MLSASSPVASFSRRSGGLRPFHGAWRTGLCVLAALFALGLWAAPASAQHAVTGTVSDAEDGTPLPGVNIIVKGTQQGATTIGDGTYELEAPSATDTLVVSFVGYEQQEVAIDNRSEIDVALQPAVTALEEVVVSVGYGEQTIETTTGSISQVSGEDLDIVPSTNLSQTLQGTVPGLVGVTSSGRPGGDDSNLLIRGASTLNNNAPLIVIDGVPGRQGGLSRLNPADIQSVSVLKDASAAIYGSRAANGVILVTTRRGRPGETLVNVNVERSYAQPTVVPEMADAPTYMQMLNEIDVAAGRDARFTQEQIEAHRGDLSGSYELFNTDWYDVALKDFSQETVAYTSVSGGGETVRYRISGEAISEDGILVNSGTGYDQFGFRSNFDGDLNDYLSLALNLHGRLEQRERPAWTRGLNSAWELLQRGKPTEPAFWPNGQPGPAQENGVNPVVSNLTGYDHQDTYYFQSSLSMDVEVPGIEGWTAQGVFAYDRQFERDKRWQEPWTLYNFAGMDANNEPMLVGVSSGVPEPRLQQFNSDARETLLRATTTYENTFFEDHYGKVLLGTEWQSSEESYLFAFRRFFLSNQIKELFAGGQAQQDIDGRGFHSARLNFFTRVNYNYRQKYLVEFIGRYDGSYIFPEDGRFGFFPAISVGWRMAQEDWFNDITGDFFDRLKLRASYGQTGNDQIEPYQFLLTYGFNGNFAYGDGLGSRISQTRVPNENVTWEVAKQFDIGIEGEVLGNRLAFDVAYFNYFRDDILWFRDEAVPETAGFSLPRENIGQVRSYGADGLIVYSQTVNEDLTFDISANLTYAKNEIEYFAEPAGVLEWQQNTGRAMETDLYYIADGIFNDQAEIDNNPSWPGARPGDIRFEDINGDGVIDGDDRRRINRNGIPNIIGGLNLSASYRQFDAGILFQGATQVQQYVFSGSVGTFGNYFQEFAEDRWTPENPDASGPRAYNRVEPYWASNENTYFLRDGKYLRVKSARFAYTLPTSLTESFSMERLQVYLTGRNLLTFSPLKVMDPELRNGAAHEYPLERAYTLGLQLSF